MKLGIRLRQSNFENLTPFQVLFRVYQMPYELNSNCVTVVTAEGYSGQLLISGFSRLLT